MVAERDSRETSGVRPLSGGATDRDRADPWGPARRGLGVIRRGTVLTAASGLLILILGDVGRAGCGSASTFPEVSSLMGYQSLVFHAGLLLGFLVLLGGHVGCLRMPLPWSGRALSITAAVLAVAALLTVVSVAAPGEIFGPATAQGGAAVAASVLGTIALAAGVLPAVTIARVRGDRALLGRVLVFGVAAAVAVFVNAEAAGHFVFDGSLATLVFAFVATAIDAGVIAGFSLVVSAAERQLAAVESPASTEAADETSVSDQEATEAADETSAADQAAAAGAAAAEPSVAGPDADRD